MAKYLTSIEDLQDHEGYVLDEKCLVNASADDSLQHTEEALVKKIKWLFNETEKKLNKKIEKFYVGVTYITELESKAEGKAKSIDFDPMKPTTTWGKDGISKRWSNHHPTDAKEVKPFAKNGMIPICAFTETNVPLGPDKKPLVNAKQYTLALEQRLQHHYKLIEPDPRNDNDTFFSGGSEKKDDKANQVTTSDKEQTCTADGEKKKKKKVKVGYVLYITLTFKEEKQKATDPPNNQSLYPPGSSPLMPDHSPPRDPKPKPKPGHSPLPSIPDSDRDHKPGAGLPTGPKFPRPNIPEPQPEPYDESTTSPNRTK